MEMEPETTRRTKTVTPRQLAANRANAKKCCGPRTTEGKLRSRANAVRHGLASAVITLPGEDTENFEERRQEYLHALAPANDLEAEVAGAICLAHWRRQLAVCHEAALIREARALYDAEFRAAYPDMPEQFLDGLAFKRLADSSGSLELLGRYEQRQANTARRAWKQLLELRNQRLSSISNSPNETIPETEHQPVALKAFAATASPFNEIALPETHSEILPNETIPETGHTLGVAPHTSVGYHSRLQPQITVLDAGGQYCHLIARKVRDLGVYAEVRPSDTPASELAGRKGIIISGGPSSVYEPGSPQMDPAVFSAGSAVLGICYGQQLMAYLLGGEVRKGDKGEYGFARLQMAGSVPLFKGIEGEQQIWMSHRDVVGKVPPGFEITGRTSTCEIAAMADPARKLFAVQFHPEVVHTPRGLDILSNFLFDICGCERDWDATGQIDALEDQIREVAAGRNVFFFVSGGVDSTVAYTLCLRALGPERVYGAYVDSGLMREGETEFVQSLFSRLGAMHFRVEDARREFLSALEGVCDPEEKRHIIGEQFVQVQERVLQSGQFLDGHWILGQGTIYPDTIESGGTARADVIKTHHNRVAGIQRLMESGRIIEPLTQFYKDEVRRIGRELGLPDEMLARHPFPGPGLAIRCLCSEEAAAVERTPDGWLLPVHSVGVQGDSRSYRPVLALDRFPEHSDRAAELVNRIAVINRVVVQVASRVTLDQVSVLPAALSEKRLTRLRRVDAIVQARHA